MLQYNQTAGAGGSASYSGFPSPGGGGGAPYPGFPSPGMAPKTASRGYYPGAGTSPIPSGSIIPGPSGGAPSAMAGEESYIENILRMNRNKMATVYMTFENNREWNAKVFRGRIETAGRDHLILSDPATGMRYLLQMVNLDYITFNEPLVYSYPYSGAVGR